MTSTHGLSSPQALEAWDRVSDFREDRGGGVARFYCITADGSYEIFYANAREPGQRYRSEAAARGERPDGEPSPNGRRFLEYVGSQVMAWGDGNGSFSDALAKRLAAERPEDPVEILAVEWPTVPFPQGSVRRGNVLLQYDSTIRINQPGRFDTILWNFPHTGGRIRGRGDETRTNQMNIEVFFGEHAENLNTDGHILITLKNEPTYHRWDIGTIAAQRGFELVEKIDFSIDDFPGYRFRPTNQRLRRFVLFPNGATTHVFRDREGPEARERRLADSMHR